jgi:hypothetical protein
MNIGNPLYSFVNKLRDTYTPVSNTSTFRKTGQITPEEFLAAGDYLVFKFPTWSWADADSPSKRANYLPPGKQFLVTRNVPCQRRLDADFAGDAGHEEALVHDGDDFKGATGGDEDGWLRTGGLSSSQPLKVREIRTVDDAGNVGDGQVVEDDDEAIIRDAEGDGMNRYVCHRGFIPTHSLTSLHKKQRCVGTGVEPLTNKYFPIVAAERTPSTSCTRPTTAHPGSTCPATCQMVNPCHHT